MVSKVRAGKNGAIVPGSNVAPRQKTLGKLSPNPEGPGPGNPRKAIAIKFLTDLSEDWNKHGKAAIAKVRRTQPAVYVRLAAALCPVDEPPKEPELSKAQVKAEIAQLMKDLGYEKRVEGTVLLPVELPQDGNGKVSD